MKRLLTLALLGSLLLAAGCRTETAPTVNVPGPNGADASKAAVPLHLASWEEVEQAIAEEKGKVVVLDVWSTWCQPCIKEFPGLVKLHEKHGDEVVCMSLNSNYTGAAGESPEDPIEQIEEFLVQQEAKFQNFVSATPDFDLYMKLGGGSVPIVRVYDKTGQLRKQFDEESQEGFTYDEHIIPLVEELLAE